MPLQLRREEREHVVDLPRRPAVRRFRHPSQGTEPLRHALPVDQFILHVLIADLVQGVLDPGEPVSDRTGPGTRAAAETRQPILDLSAGVA